MVIDLLVGLTLKSIANLKTLQNLWRPEQYVAFIKVKEVLTSAPDEAFIIHEDASNCGAGAFLV